MNFFAHSLQDQPSSAWELLADHLRLVAEGKDQDNFQGAKGFAAHFGASYWGRLAGRWHDLGKYSLDFQAYLENPESLDAHALDLDGTVDHSTAGAQHAHHSFGSLGIPLAYCIAGHHAGLPDWESGLSGLRERLRKDIPSIDSAPPNILEGEVPTRPEFDWDRDPRRLAFQIGLFTRMLFSCLVDADFLATERFMSPQRTALRPEQHPSPRVLLSALDDHLGRLQVESDETPVNQQRRNVLSACREKSLLPPGLFSLNVPTGGGKTLSSLAFALTHARAHGLQRVMYAIPFTSIVEQTVDAFRQALGDHRDAVLEHHSNIDQDDPRQQSSRTRLAAENWDASLVVTTNVQLFESLFASRTSKCRKLHRLAKSVIILDEAQTLPPQLLAPTLAVIDELCRNYGSTVVLCTATQPAVERNEDFPIGLDAEKVRPIIDDPHALHEALRRTRVEVLDKMDDKRLVECLANERQALCIVNSRRHAADLFRLLNQTVSAHECLHLSANMCPAHRGEVVAEVRRRLDRKVNEPCRVIATQVIEAGVDVDFPAVFRAAAGLDSIAQAAGRCNREGRREIGRVVVFEYDEQTHRAPPFIRRAADAARQIIPEHEHDLLSPRAIAAYFEQHYWRVGGENGAGWDRGRGAEGKSVMNCFREKGLECQFREAAELYRLIDDAQTAVLVPYGEKGQGLRRELEEMPDPPDPKHLRSWDRRAQRYAVSVFDHGLRMLLENQVLMQRHERYYLANNDAYDKQLGLTFEAVGLDPELLIR